MGELNQRNTKIVYMYIVDTMFVYQVWCSIYYALM